MQKKVSLKKNTFYNAIKIGSNIIFPLITFPYVNRVLLVESVGKINFGLSIVNYFSLLASLGINTYAIRECSKNIGKIKQLSKIASEIFSINIISMLISYTLLFMLLIFYTPLSNYWYLIIIQSLSILFATIGTDWINSAMEDFKYIAIRTLTFHILSIILIFIFIKTPKDYLLYAIISLIPSIGANIVNIFYRKRFCNISFIFSSKIFRHLKPILYMFVMILAQSIYTNMDVTMLGIMKNDYYVGIYTTAYKVCTICELLVTSIFFVVMPRLSVLYSKKMYEKINFLFNKIFVFTITFGLPIFIGLMMMSKDCILLLAGNEYIEAQPVLLILSLSSLTTIFAGSLVGNILFLSSGREKYTMKVCIIVAIFNFTLNYIIIPKYSACGAAFTTFLSSVLTAILLYSHIDKFIHIDNFIKRVLPTIFGSFLIFIICILSRSIGNIYLRVIFSISLSIVIYFFIQIIFTNEIVLRI